MEYLISDITENGFDHAFDVVVDKGPFDALLCGGMAHYAGDDNPAM